VEKSGNRSYAEIVTADSQEQWKGPSIKVQQLTMPWMETSVVGKLREDMDVDRLGEELVKGGMNMVKVRLLGDNLVLLTPSAGENMEDVIKLNKEWADRVFVSFKPWSNDIGPSHKTMWVRCYGLPFSFWSRDCFTKVIGIMAPSATLKAVDDSTVSWEILEYARLQVRILKLGSAKMAKCVRVNNHPCNILIEEEPPELYEDMNKDNHPSYDSSDSVSSTETYIEETDFSVINGEEENRPWDAKVSRSKVEEEGEERKEEDEQCSHRTKLLSTDSLSESTGGQWNAKKAITKAESKGHKGLGGVDLSPDSDFGGDAAFLRSSEQADLAKVVVDMECNIKPNENHGVLGLEEVEARVAEGWPSFVAQKVVEDGGSVARAMEEDSRQRDLSNTTHMPRGSPIGGTRMGGSKGEHMSFSEGRIPGDCEPLSGSLSWSRETNGVQCENEDGKGGGEVGGKLPGTLLLPNLVGNDGAKVRSKTFSPPRRRKKKELAELGDPFSQPRRSSRMKGRRNQAVSSSSNRIEISLVSISDKDIHNCNLRRQYPCVMEEPPNLWEIRKKCGLACREDEEEVIKEYGSMEARDVEVRNCHKEGIEESIP